MLAPTALPFSI